MNTKVHDDEKMPILSIGHSTMDYRQFYRLLKGAGITAIADVRSSPYSRSFPHFNREDLKRSLSVDGIAYVFLGKELGGRPNNPEYYTDGIADYDKMATSADFERGLERLEQGARKYCIALMCSERNPLDCHRCLLVGRALKERGHSISHLLESGVRLNQDEIESHLLKMFNKQDDDMFSSQSDRTADAYRARARKVAYSDTRRVEQNDFTAGAPRT